MSVGLLTIAATTTMAASILMAADRAGPANYGSPVVVAGGTSQDIFGVHVEIGTEGQLHVTGNLHDRQIHAWTAVFLSSARTVSLLRFGGWDVCCMWIEDSTGVHGPYQPGSQSFAAGW